MSGFDNNSSVDNSIDLCIEKEETRETFFLVVIPWSLSYSLGGSVNHPAIQARSIPVSQVANLPGHYEIPNKT